tara:strand:+ start:709 stop:1014 length:306 start_codon:yes stop_codon:yes gene_type:complete
MCECSSYKKVVDLPHIKIYLEMADYKIKDKYVGQISWTTSGSFKINWCSCSQEELAYAYEEVGLTEYIEKTTKTSKDEEKTSTTKKSSKKASSNEKESDKE